MKSATPRTRPYKAISVMGDTMAATAYETDSVLPHSMKGPETAVGAAPCGRPPVLRWGMFPHHPVGEGLAPPAVRFCCILPETP